MELCQAWYQADGQVMHVCDLPLDHDGRHVEHFPNGQVFTWFRDEDAPR